MILEVDFECRDIPSSSASQIVEFEARKRAVSNRRRSPRCVSVALVVWSTTGQRVEGDGAVGFALCVAVLSCFGSKTREEGSHMNVLLRTRQAYSVVLEPGVSLHWSGRSSGFGS